MKINYKNSDVNETYFSEDIFERFGLSLEKFYYIIKNNSYYLKISNEEIPSILSDWTFNKYLTEDLNSLKNIPKIYSQVKKIENGEFIPYSIIIKNENGIFSLLDGGHRLLSAYKLCLGAEVLVLPELLSTEENSQKKIDDWFIEKYPEFRSTIQEQFNNTLNDYISDGETSKSINDGLCSDFANSLNKIVKQSRIIGIYGYEDLVEACYDYDFSFDLECFKNIENYYFPFSHTFLNYEGKFYDSECINGVYKIEDIPIIKRNIEEYMKDPFVNKIWIKFKSEEEELDFVNNIKENPNYAVDKINVLLEDESNWSCERLMNSSEFYHKKILFKNREIYICFTYSNISKEILESLSEIIDNHYNAN